MNDDLKNQANVGGSSSMPDISSMGTQSPQANKPAPDSTPSQAQPSVGGEQKQQPVKPGPGSGIGDLPVQTPSNPKSSTIPDVSKSAVTIGGSPTAPDMPEKAGQTTKEASLSHHTAPPQTPIQPIAPPIDNAPIHTMPSKFIPGGGQSMKPAPSSSSLSGKKMALILIIVIIVLGGVSAGVYFYLNPPPARDTANTPDTPQVTPPATNNTTPDPVNTTPPPTNNENINTPPPASDEDAEKQTRDAQRVTDVLDIARALDQYYLAEEQYPQFIAVIPSDMLVAAPLDPLTNRQYAYGPKQNRQSYAIIFDIEHSASMNGQLLTTGSYELTPDQSVAPIGDDPIDSTPTPPQGSNLDADADGLTSSEEQLFQTSAANKDSDADGFMDNVEISNFFSPINSGAVTLDQTPLVSRYVNPSFGYSFYYPKQWTVTTLNSNDREVVVVTGTGEDFTFNVIENIKSQTAWEWYAENISYDFNPQNVDIDTIEGIEAVRPFDGLGAYMAVGNDIYEIKYNLNGILTVNYPNVFLLLLDQLKLAN